MLTIFIVWIVMVTLCSLFMFARSSNRRLMLFISLGLSGVVASQAAASPLFTLQWRTNDGVIFPSTNATIVDLGNIGQSRSNFQAQIDFIRTNAANNVRSYGAMGNWTNDDTVAIAAAIAASPYHALFFPSGVYKISNTIGIPQGAYILGEGSGGGYYNLSLTTTNPPLALVQKSGESIIMLAAGANCTMFTNSTTSAEVERVTTSPYDGRGTVTQYVYNAVFDNIVIHGNGRSQTKYNCDLFNITDAWSLTFNRCQFVYPAGYFGRIWNCNVVRFLNCISSGELAKSKGFIFFDSSDSEFKGSTMGGGVVGPFLWLATPSTWRNNFSGMQIGDTQNLEIGGQILSVGSNLMTLSDDPRLENGDPFIFYQPNYTNSSLPSGITLGQTYFAVRNASNIFGYSTNVLNALVGIADGVITDIGTNCMVKPGASTALLSTEAQLNTFTDCRFDNGQDGCITLIDSSYNSFAQSIISHPGFNFGGTRLDRNALWIVSGFSNVVEAGCLFTDAATGVRVDSSGNYINGPVFFNCSTNYLVNSGTLSPVMKNAVGSSFVNNFNITAANTSAPLTIVASNTPTVIDLQRIGSTPVGMLQKLTITGDNRGSNLWYVADRASGRNILGATGSMTNSWVQIGGPGNSTTNDDLAIFGDYSTGTNANGHNLFIAGGGGTGTGTPGRLNLGSFTATASGSNPQTGRTNGVSIGSTDIAITTSSLTVNGVPYSSGGSSVSVNGTNVSSPNFTNSSSVNFSISSGTNVSATSASGTSGTMVKVSGTFASGTIPIASDTTGTNYSSSGVTADSSGNITIPSQASGGLTSFGNGTYSNYVSAGTTPGTLVGLYTTLLSLQTNVNLSQNRPKTSFSASGGLTTNINYIFDSSPANGLWLGAVSGVTNETLSHIGFGLGLTNNGGVLSNNIVAGSNISLTAGANGQITVASTSSGISGTVVSSGSATAGMAPYATDTSGTNIAWSASSTNRILVTPTITTPTITGTANLQKVIVTNALSFPVLVLASTNVDFSTGMRFQRALAANEAFAFTNPSDGQEARIYVTNSSNFTTSWPAIVDWKGTATPIQSPNQTDEYRFTYNGNTGRYLGEFLPGAGTYGTADQILATVSAGGSTEWRTLTPGLDTTISFATAITTVGKTPTLSTMQATDTTTTSTTLANVGTMSCTLVAGKKYGFDMYLYVNESTTIDGAKFDFNGGTATATTFVAWYTPFDTALNTPAKVTSLATAQAIAMVAGEALIEAHGSIIVNAGGTFKPRFAQNSHTTGTLTLYTGSRIHFYEITN